MLTIQARHNPGENFWWASISEHQGPIRRVRSLDEVRGLVGEFQCSPRRLARRLL